MSFSRQLQRKQLKEQWKLFKKENKQFKNMTFSHFRKLWKESVLEATQENVAQEYTQKEQEELSDMFVEEVFENEDTVAE